jgi:hypothetical protein
MERALGSRADTLAETLDVRYGKFEELLIGRADKVTEQVETRTRAAADLLNARMEQLSQSIESNASHAARNLGELAHATSDAIRASAGEAERALRGTSEAVAQSFSGQTERIVTEVGQRTRELENILTDKSGILLTAISEKGREFSQEIERATDQVLSSVEQKGVAFARSIAEDSEQMSRLINEAGNTATQAVTRTLTELQTASDQAVARSRETAQAAVSELTETHNLLRSDTTALFGRLREANLMLQEVLSGSHENMSALENTLMLRVSEFVSAMNEVTTATGDVTSRMESNIGGFRQVTGDVLSNLGQLARQFDEHASHLAKAAELIQQSNRATEQSIGDRHGQLQALVGALDARTEDIAQRLTRFSGLLDQSLETAATRARDIARLVSDSSSEGLRAIEAQVERARKETEQLASAVQNSAAETAGAIATEYARVREETEEVARNLQVSGSEGARVIAEQYARLREQADAERRRAAAAMHEVYEQNAGDAQALFEQANQRFAETVRSMKQMAAEMQRELEATRAQMQRELESTREELRRGVLELPQQTTENAAQMRRVIVDQIEALAELNRIVARHGRNLDATEPTRRAEPAASVIAPRREQPTRSEPVRPEPPARPALRNNDPSSFAPAPRRVATTSATPEVPSDTAPGATAGRGWLTDLLNRASRDDEPTRDFARERAHEPTRPEPQSRAPEERSPRHSIESLDSLSVDIARMIDHEAAIDLWDRYNRGERNVFTRRLYTLQGQQAFEELRKKYRTDRDFKQTVDRYLGEFERLLDDVSHDDRGQMVARTYLTSDTGKVYTMLAHAAGRLD